MAMTPDQRRCRRCRGTGRFIVGRPRAKRVGDPYCFRCGGKGYQTVSDVKRNQCYDQGLPDYLYNHPLES